MELLSKLISQVIKTKEKLAVPQHLLYVFVGGFR